MTSTPTVRFLDRTTPPHIATLILLAGVSALNMSIFLPSLNAMTIYFDTDYGIMQLAVSLYLATTALLQVVVGPISDRFGRRPVLLVTLAIFMIATIGAMMSTSIGAFLAFRMLQAVVATGMVLSRAVVRDMVPQDQAASMIGYVTMGVALVPMIGPAIGGGLEELFDWRAIFALIAVAGFGVLVLTWFDLGETVQGKGISFSEQIEGYPELLRSPRFWGYTLAAAFGSGAFFALLGGASIISESVFDLSPVQAGIALGTPAIGYALGNYLSGRYSVALGINRLALLGAAITTGGMALSLVITLAGTSHPIAFFGSCTFLGLGNGLLMPNSMAGALSVRPRLAGTASGLSGAIMIGGGAVLAALAGALLTKETGTLPLQIIMVVSSAFAAVSIGYVMRRDRQLAAADLRAST